MFEQPKEPPIDLETAAKIAREIRHAYTELNAKQGRPEWRATDYVAGLMGDVGDLSKLVLASDGLRTGADVRERLRHELADCLWSVFTIADLVQVDLAEDFPDQMEKLLARVDLQVHTERREHDVAIPGDVADALGQ